MDREPRFPVLWMEDGSALALGRLAAPDGTGAWTGEIGEGNWLKQSDFAVGGLTFKLFDLDGTDPDTEVASGTLTPAAVILDTPDTTNHLWTRDEIGYNFKHLLPPTYFPEPHHRIELEYRGETTGSSVFHAIYEGKTRPIRSS